LSTSKSSTIKEKTNLMIKKGIQRILNKFGYQIYKKKDLEKRWVYKNNMVAGLERSFQKGIEIETVIDIGASNGMWSESCLKYYPEASYFLIEAQKEHQLSLDKFKGKYANVDYKIAAAGGREGFVFFDNSDLFGGLAIEKEDDRNRVKVPVTTIDIEVYKNSLKPPFLIKLDTHGYELPILEGAKETLKNSNIVIIEVYNFVIADKSIRFWEMCAYMDKLGFLPIDLVDVLHRKNDNSLWQFDLIFIKKDRKEFSFTTYE
jgi:FkbM family methyltransferase